jgi:hypothetical protein
MVKKALVFLLFAGVAAAATARTLYQIELRSEPAMISRDLPVRNGSMFLFHRHPDGRLTGVPREEVIGVAELVSSATSPRTVRPVRLVTAPAAAESPEETRAATPLKPGDTLVLGPTGEGSARAAAEERFAESSTESTAVPADQILLTSPYGSVPFGAGANTPITNQPGAPGGRPLASGGPAGSFGAPPILDGTGRPVTGTAIPGNLAPAPVPALAPLGPPTLPGSTMSPVGATPPGSTMNPVGSTPPGTTIRPAGTTPQGTTVQPASPGQGAAPRG